MVMDEGDDGTSKMPSRLGARVDRLASRLNGAFHPQPGKRAFNKRR